MRSPRLLDKPNDRGRRFLFRFGSSEAVCNSPCPRSDLQGPASVSRPALLRSSRLAGRTEVEVEDDESMSFFVTSRGSGSGGDFGGLAGADALCATLAAEASAELGAKSERAYLSTSTVNARDRIGAR